MRLRPLRDPVSFTFDGRRMQGHDEEPLAAALMANDIRVVGRSFKYHRPRGLFAAGSEEPNALVTVDGVPNQRATMVPLREGLAARSQNRWPSVRFDVGAVNDAASPFLSAGFYYKTFMWPRSFWERVYEPAIRRAAGLGRLKRTHDDTPQEKAFAFCDLLVIGAGPTGLMAALTAARAGVDVILADEDTQPGGRLLSDGDEIDGAPAADWIAFTLAELRARGVRIMPRTTVTGAYDQGTYAALERVSDGTGAAPRDCFWRITARAAVLATGAIERGIAFSGNDRPGILLAGAVRSYIGRWGVAPGRRVAVFGNTDDVQATARAVLRAGLEVAAVIDARDHATAPADVPLFAGSAVEATWGRKGLTSIMVRHPGGRREVECDALAVTGGWNPSVHLTCHLGARPVWDAGLAAFVPAPDAVPGLHPAGAANGVFALRGCLADGLRAASDALAALGTDAPEVTLPQAANAPYDIRPVWSVPGKGRAWLDLQNDVTVKDVTLAAQENFASVEHMKRYTTQGMAPDQGKTSNVSALAVLADATGRGIPATGTTTFRPPFVPVPIGAMGAGARGMGFAPVRRVPSHAAAAARGAPMVEAGLWLRPSWFPIRGETTWRQSCDREAATVRRTVGVCDVSTLGKIELHGPDVGEFLDFAYTSRMSTLKPGRVRYGLMLREDGHVMDDGTVACISPGHYILTTTTGAAGAVMAHLDHAAQVLRPDLDITLASVTEAWAQFAVAGPRSRDLLNTLLDTPTDDATLPYMGCADATIGGLPARLFRISFSGERAYEIAVPVAYGDGLWRLLVAQAEAMEGCPYGMEALNVLRIEKGFLTHAELDGRTTARDLGLARMEKDADHIGRAASLRPGLAGDVRPELIGLRPVAPGGTLTAGAHLFDAGAPQTRETDIGHVTSVCHSPALGHMIGLGFLRDGRARHGDRVILRDWMRDVETTCEVCPPVFLDPDGGRMRG